MDDKKSICSNCRKQRTIVKVNRDERLCIYCVSAMQRGLKHQPT
jgi:hypothetical protein